MILYIVYKFNLDKMLSTSEKGPRIDCYKLLWYESLFNVVCIHLIHW